MVGSRWAETRWCQAEVVLVDESCGCSSPHLRGPGTGPVLLARHDTPLCGRRDCSRGAWGAPRRHWGTAGAAGPEERPRCTPDSDEHKGLFGALVLCADPVPANPLVIRAPPHARSGCTSRGMKDPPPREWPDAPRTRITASDSMGPSAQPSQQRLSGVACPADKELHHNHVLRYEARGIA